MKPDFSLIDELAVFLEPFPAEWFVSGGWAIDLYLGRVTRKRGDLDISVPFTDRLACVEFFLARGWVIEGKLGDGFKRVERLADYQDELRYFWSFPPGAAFVGEYVDEAGNRRISYNRKTQTELDYIEVFFDRIEGGEFVYRRDERVRREIAKVVLERDGIKYLAPEVALLFKSKQVTEKNQQDFEAAAGALSAEAAGWLRRALGVVYREGHRWMESLVVG